MSKEQVAGIASLGPYTGVSSTGGLETTSGELDGRRVTVSFVFGPVGLQRVQVWAYEGQDLAEASEAWFEVYAHLVRNFGEVTSTLGHLGSALSAPELRACLPSGMTRPVEPTLIDRMTKGGGRIQLQPPAKVQMRPVVYPQGAEVFASLIRSSELGSYWVFLYYVQAR